MKILITGGAGFIGSHVAEIFRQADHEVAILDDFSSGKPENVLSDSKVYRGSIEDRGFVEQVLKEFQPEVICHHAAQVSVVVSVEDPVTDAARNVLGTVILLQAARQTPSVKKFIYASSGGAMYGNPSMVPCGEDASAEPISPYGLSKYTAERYVWLYTALSSFEATVLRYSNVYGPRQDPHGEAGVCAIFAQAMLDKKPVKIFGDGSQVRDYVFVGDVAAANLAALEKGNGEAFHISTGQGTSTQEVYTLLKAATEYPLEAVAAPSRLGEAQTVILDAGKAKRLLGWHAKTSFQEGINQTIAWYRKEQAGGCGCEHCTCKSK